MGSDSAEREIVVPAQTLADLLGALGDVGAGGTGFRVLRSAGRTAGRGTAAELAPRGAPAAELAEDVFWSRLSDLMTRRGWGSVSHSAPHPGVGLIESTDWAEPGTNSPFSEGLFSGLLSGVAGGDVSVIRVPSGYDRAAFVYGAPATIEALQVHLADRGDLAAALEAL